MPFNWHPDEPPPVIKPHSKAKLDVLRRYLRTYFDRLNVNPQREQFKLDLVDGFAGGGLFRDQNGSDVSGTPLVMLEEARKADTRLNANRSKPLQIDCKFYFTDKEKAHTDCLRRVLAERGHTVDGDRIIVRNERFENEARHIIDSIKQRQPRARRAIFLLDQTGFSQVSMSLVARILRELQAAEVILTFAADALVNHLAETPQSVKMTAPLGLTEAWIRDTIQRRDGDGGKALVQRSLLDHIRIMTGAAYDTPFFIRPGQSRRALWILHLSRHPTARDVMIRQHWECNNTFLHYGPGDFNMLGWDELQDSKVPPLFNFSETDRRQMHSDLLESLPMEVHSLVSEQPATIEAIRNLLANRTAARFSDLDGCILEIVQEGEFNILDPEGNVRSRSLKNLRPTDRLALTGRRMFSGFSRLS